MKKGYKVYNYDECDTLITRTDQIKEYFDYKFKHLDIDIDDAVIEETVKESIDKAIGESFQDTIEMGIKDTIKDSLCCVDKQFHHVNHHIECAKNMIIDKISDSNIDLTNVATKADIEEAVLKVNNHTTTMFDEIDFNAKFSDLNQQIKNLSENGYGRVDSDISSVLASITDIDKSKFEDGTTSDIDYNQISIGGGTY